MKCLLAVVVSVFILAVVHTTSEAVSYIVVHKIVPITGDPFLKYEVSAKGIGLEDGVNDYVIFGNIIEAFPVKGKKYRRWLQVKTKENELGFIERKAVAKFPDYNRMQPEKFWVKENDTLLYILPGRESFSKKRGGIRLPYGMTVVGVGSVNKNGISWTLLRFDDNEDMQKGMGERYGWIKSSLIERL
jgi:hypothetical protein